MSKTRSEKIAKPSILSADDLQLTRLADQPVMIACDLGDKKKAIAFQVTSLEVDSEITVGKVSFKLTAHEFVKSNVRRGARTERYVLSISGGHLWTDEKAGLKKHSALSTPVIAHVFRLWHKQNKGWRASLWFFAGNPPTALQQEEKIEWDPTQESQPKEKEKAKA